MSVRTPAARDPEDGCAAAPLGRCSVAPRPSRCVDAAYGDELSGEIR